MIRRCSDPNFGNYARYGGRGIRVCEQWQGPRGFEQFLADMGKRPDGKTLDRADSNGNYEPSNCRWLTPVEQARNTRAVKLTMSAAREIRARATRGETHVSIALSFGVDASNVNHVVAGRAWKESA